MVKVIGHTFSEPRARRWSRTYLIITSETSKALHGYFQKIWVGLEVSRIQVSQYSFNFGSSFNIRPMWLITFFCLTVGRCLGFSLCINHTSTNFQKYQKAARHRILIWNSLYSSQDSQLTTDYSRQTCCGRYFATLLCFT